MMESEKRVAVVTGASQGIGEALVKAYRQRGYRVVATARSIGPTSDPDILAVAGDISDVSTGERVIAEGMKRFGRIDTLVNNAGLFLAKPFTHYSEADYQAVMGVNVAGFFGITRPAIAQIGKAGRRPRGADHHDPGGTRRFARSVGAGLAVEGRPERCDAFPRDRIRKARHTRERRIARHHPHAHASAGEPRRPRCAPSGRTYGRGRRGRRRRGPARDAGHGRAGAAHRLRDQGVPDPLAYRRGAGRHRGQLANMGPDSWQWHMYDTVKGSDWLGDTDAMEYLAREAPKAVYELEHYGVPFSRTEEGKIYQRPFGGHTTRIRRRPAGAAHLRRRRPHRPRHPAHALRPVAEEQRGVLHRIFRARPDHGADGACTGVVAWKLDDGTIHVFNAKMVVLATGGYGRAYFSRPRPIPAPATAAAWWRAPACRCRTWSSCSSTRPASMARAA
jgi:hypothetical protein